MATPTTIDAGREREVVIELARRGELEYRRLVERVLKEAGIDRAQPSLGMASEVPALVSCDDASLPGLAPVRIIRG
jgi:hypothetical protein